MQQKSKETAAADVYGVTEQGRTKSRCYLSYVMYCLNMYKHIDVGCSSGLERRVDVDT
jgi:hypothetical protein